MALTGYVGPVARLAPTGEVPEDWFQSQVAKCARVIAEAYVRIVILAYSEEKSERPPAYVNCMIELPLSLIDDELVRPSDLMTIEGVYVGEMGGFHYAIDYKRGGLFWNETGVDERSQAFADARPVSVWFMMYHRVDPGALLQFIKLEK